MFKEATRGRPEYDKELGQGWSSALDEYHEGQLEWLTVKASMAVAVLIPLRLGSRNSELLWPRDGS